MFVIGFQHFLFIPNLLTVKFFKLNFKGTIAAFIMGHKLDN